VKDHWDQIQLKCWVTKDGKRSLYQDATLAALMSPEEWKPIFKKLGIENLNNSVFFSGTINTVGKQLIYADSYELEMIDPVLKRTLRHEYRVAKLIEGIK
jgi:predicted metal-binding transcription factor (methanogenesis marker protein 9)